MIKRDKYNYIGQHNADYPDYLDFGDCARSTGLMAMAGSEIDQKLIDTFVIEELKIVRHPFDPMWNKPEQTSRDQVMAWSAGINERNVEPLAKATCRAACYRYANYWFINKDVLLPHYKLALYRASKYNYSIFISILGWPLLLLHILYMCWIKPNAEQNQTIAMLRHFPLWTRKLYLNLHPNVEKNISDYFDGYPWRDQKEISAAINDYLRKGYINEV